MTVVKPPPPDGRGAVLAGIVHMLVGIAILAVISVLVKLLSARYSIIEVAFFRSLFALVPATAMVIAAGGFRTLRTGLFWFHARRASIGVLSMTLMFWSYQLLPLADAVAVGFSAPLFLNALSGPMLGERIGPHRWCAVLAGFVGVLIILKPSSGMFQLGALVALGAALAYAFSMIAIRQLTVIDRSSTIIFYFTLNATLLLAMPLPLVWLAPTPYDAALMAVIGLLGGGTQYFITRACTLAPPSVVAPFNYALILWATLFGFLLWGDLPDRWVVLGSAIVIASGLEIAYRETRRSGDRAKP